MRKKKQREDTLRRAKGSSVRQPLYIRHTSDDYQPTLIPSTLESALPTEKTDLTPQRPPSHSIYSLYHLGVLYVMLRASVSANECDWLTQRPFFALKVIWIVFGKFRFSIDFGWILTQNGIFKSKN